eukprot:6199754-Pleurochrysis_carterae.AAC.1
MLPRTHARTAFALSHTLSLSHAHTHTLASYAHPRAVSLPFCAPQCRNPVHRAHYELFTRALDAPNVADNAVVLVHPTCGPTQASARACGHGEGMAGAPPRTLSPQHTHTHTHTHLNSPPQSSAVLRECALLQQGAWRKQS